MDSVDDDHIERPVRRLELEAQLLVMVRPGAAGLRKSDVDCDALFAAGHVTPPEAGIRPRCGVYLHRKVPPVARP